MLKTLDQFRSVYHSRGLDFSNPDGIGRPEKVALRDWLGAGVKQLKEVIGKGDLRFEDTISTPDITPWLPQVVERVVLEAQEPLIVLTNLFERQQYEPGQVIQYPAVGAVTAADIAEGESYPTVRLQESGATVTAKVGKSGIAFEISEEAQNYSRYDIVNMHLRACAKALARHKEVKAAKMISSLGTVVFDNLAPTSSMLGVTHGRSINGAANGSMILDDLFDTFAQIMMQGFTPDTVIMNPLTFIMFLKDEVLRAVTLAGGNQIWYGGYTGNPAKTGPGSASHVSGGQKITPGSAASGATASGLNAYNTALDSAPELPRRWPWPLKIVVSPWMYYHPGTNRTHLVVCDSNELGYYIEEHGVKVDKWEDLAIDSTKWKLKERYCFHIKNEGLGVGVMRNVKIVPNEVVLPAQTTLAVSGAILGTIPATTPV